MPLPTSRLGALSPQAVTILGQQSLLFTLGGSTSHPLSIDPSRTELGLAFFGGFGLLLLGTARALTRESANRLAGALLILGVALATVGIVQRATFTGKIYGFWELVQGGAPFGPFVNRNHFAGWMLIDEKGNVRLLERSAERGETLTTPLLPGFAVSLADLFASPRRSAIPCTNQAMRLWRGRT